MQLNLRGLKNDFRTHQEIENHYRNQGVDIDRLNREMKCIGIVMKMARVNIKKRRGFLKHFFIILKTEFPFPMLGYTHPEEEAEYQRLEKLHLKEVNRETILINLK